MKTNLELPYPYICIYINIAYIHIYVYSDPPFIAGGRLQDRPLNALKCLPHKAVRCDRQIQGDARGGGLVFYVRAALVLFAIYPAAGTSNVLEKLAVVIPLPGQKKIIVATGIYPPETSNFLQGEGFSDSEYQTELQQIEIICADLIAHDPL